MYGSKSLNSLTAILAVARSVRISKTCRYESPFIVTGDDKTDRLKERT